MIPQRFIQTPMFILTTCLFLGGLSAVRSAEPVLEFSGSGSYIDLGAPEALHMAEDAPFTIEGWVKLNSFSSVDMIYSRRASRGSGDYTYMFGTGDGNQMRAYIGHGGSPNTTWRDISLDPVLETGRWYHLAFSFDGEELVYYLDGVAIGTNAFRYSDHAGYQVMIGGYHDASDVDGSKSDVRVWDHARSQEQIQTVMTNRLTGAQTGLLGYWPLNEGSGSTVYDRTFYKTEGTVINAEWGVDTDLDLEPADIDFRPAWPFTLADMETGSTKFTNSNKVDIVAFPIPEGYEQFQITEDGEIEAIDAAGWLSTNAIDSADFTQPSADSNVTLYAWFTNENVSVELRRSEGFIFYTESLPIPDVRTTVTIERLSGEDVVIYPSHIDFGSTGGIADGREMAITARAAVCAEEPSCDQTPNDPFVTVNSEGDYSIVLWLQNEAGNTVISATTSTVSVIPYSGENVWTGEGITDAWHEPANWTAGVPVDDQIVRVESGTPLVTAETAELASFTMTGGTMMFSNWTTRLRADTVDLQVGTLTLPEAFEEGVMSNRVWIVADYVIVGENALIDADYRGFARDHAPGNIRVTGSYGVGAGYGGSGAFGQAAARVGGQPYGSVSAPTDPGSGGANTGSDAGHGGGAIRIDATNGTVTVEGTITARGQSRRAIHAGGGSGGAVFITCNRFEGSPTGLIRVSGGGSSNGGGAGGGGRIAVIYDPVAQDGHNPGVRFNAARGSGGYRTGEIGRNSQDGTLYLPDTTLLSETLAGQFQSVRLFGPATWAPDSLTVTDTSLMFEQEGFELTIPGDLTIGANGTLGIGPHGHLQAETLQLSEGGQLDLLAGPTNGVTPAFGGLLEIAGTALIAAGSWIYPESDILNGGSPLMRFGELTIAEGGGINANIRGWGADEGPGKGYGSIGGGGGYGGAGAQGDAGSATPGEPYGNAMVPTLPGSGGGGQGRGSRAGGLIWMEIERAFELEGSLLANASNAPETHGGGGSGGGIFVICESMTTSEGTRIEARGGNYSNRGGGGGGGRVAFWVNVSENNRERILAGEERRMVFQDKETTPFYVGEPVSVLGGSPTTSRPGEPGTIRWFWSEVERGSLFMLR